MVQTSRGDLLLDKAHKGRVYLKGLRVAGHGPDGREYKIGYNFVTGSINRDRERLMNLKEEAGMIAAIWGRAILKENEQRSSKIADTYLKLLQEAEECPDAALVHQKIIEPTAIVLWQRLLTSSDGVFFYYDDDLVDNVFTSQVSHFGCFPFLSSGANILCVE